MSACGKPAMNTVSEVNPGIARQGHLQPVSPKNRTTLGVEKMTPSEARYYAGSNPFLIVYFRKILILNGI